MPPHFIGPKGSVKSALIAEGAAILGQVSDSVIFYNVTIEEGARVTNSVIMPGTVVEAGAVGTRPSSAKTAPSQRCGRSKDGSVAVLGRHGE